MIRASEIIPLTDSSAYLVPSQTDPHRTYVVVLLDAGAVCVALDGSPCQGFLNRSRCAHVESARSFRAVHAPVERLNMGLTAAGSGVKRASVAEDGR